MIIVAAPKPPKGGSKHKTAVLRL